MESQNFPENKKADLIIVTVESMDWWGNVSKTKMLFDRSAAQTIYETEKPRLFLPGTIKIALIVSQNRQWLIEKIKNGKTKYKPVSREEGRKFVMEIDFNAYVSIFKPSLL